MILGKTGSGKSTWHNYYFVFMILSKESYCIGSQNLKDIKTGSLRDQISYVPQDVFLFSDTVSHNISFGLQNPAANNEVMDAAKYASVHKEIEGLTKGYDTIVGERGVTLSGGQKQRISIARALIKKSDILIFDDCLSAVDSKTENEIVTNLYQFLTDKTAIIITHRTFSIFSFDKIIVLEEGKIIEEGTHEQLLVKDGYYAEVYKLQMINKESAEISF